MKFLYLILTVILALAPSRLSALNNPTELIQTLNDKLRTVKSSADSVLVLENLYDLSLQYEPHKSDSLAELTYQVADRAENHRAAFDMIRQRANLNYANDSILSLMHSRAARRPSCDGNRERTLTFIGVMTNSALARDADEDTRRKRFDHEVRQYITTPSASIYDKIVLLHGVCVNLAREAHGELLINYMDQLGRLIDSVPDPEFVLRNVFYVQGAIDYTLSGHPKKAIEADRKLLNTIDSLEIIYSRAGRPYRYYDSNRFIIYTRMLANWPELSREEIEDYYRSAAKIQQSDIRAGNAHAKSRRLDVFYAMARKDYPTAYALLKEVIDNPANKMYRRQFLKYLTQSASAVGDKTTALEASNEYIKLLDKDLADRVQERYKELQIIYDVQEIQSQYDSLNAAMRSSETASQRRIIIISLVFVAILLVLVCVLVWLYRKARRLAATLARANDSLRRESDNLRQSQAELTKARDLAENASNFKSDFIKNLSREVSVPLKAISEYSHLIVDCTESASRPYLERYADLIDQNNALINAIAEDVLHMAEIDSNTLDIKVEPVNLARAVSAVVDSVRPRAPKSVALVFDENSPRIDITTDRARLQQVLIALVANAVKFTTKGSVAVAYSVGADGNSVEITVTDTGIGIPADKAEYIFERFAKLDREAQGVGLGLSIARMLARMLGGDVRLDTTYTHGARFILTLPTIYKA